MKDFVNNLPKAEVHVHLDGALSPELIIKLASRNGVDIPFKSIDDINNFYKNINSQNFFTVFPIIISILKTEQDFYDVLFSYLVKAHIQNIKHAEIHFELQSFPEESIDMILNGLYSASCDARLQFGISSNLILAFLRQIPESNAISLFHKILKHKDKIKIIGLGGPELNNPTNKFKDLYKLAKKYDFKTSIHAGEGTDYQNIYQAINLEIDRIDHGIACMQDPKLLDILQDRQIPITVCPVSNIKLGFYGSIKEHPIKKMLNSGLLVSVNSDDPECFQADLNSNYIALCENLILSKKEIETLALNSFKSSFIDI